MCADFAQSQHSCRVNRHVRDNSDPVILKRRSLSLPVFLMEVIIFLAELRAAQVLWGPCPRNDSALIRESAHNTGLQSNRKSKLCENTAKYDPSPKNRDPSEGQHGGELQTLQRGQRSVTIKTEKHWIRDALLTSGSNTVVLKGELQDFTTQTLF